MKTIFPLIITTLFLFAPAFPDIERLAPKPQNDLDVPFHTPAHTEGKLLPQHIEETTTLGPEDGLILIHTMVTVRQGATLTIRPGTTVAVSEYGGIRVHGILNVQGTEKNPVSFISNELNEMNRSWNGILYEKTSSGTIEHAVFHHASPAISCSMAGKVTIRDNTYLFGNLELYGPC